MRGIERYETWVSRVRDGAWLIAVATAIFGYTSLGAALIFGGLAWFALGLVGKVPRAILALRRLLAGRWRAINRLLLVHVAVITLAAEAARTGLITSNGYGAILTLVLAFLLFSTALVMRRIPAQALKARQDSG